MHFYYIFGLAYILVNVWALLTVGEQDPDIEKMWMDNL